MKIGDFEVDFEGLLIDGPAGRQSMEPKVMRLLRVLVDNAGKVMTREDLITAVWGVEYGGDERLSRGISLLRKALGDKKGHHRHILTISRVGYRFIADIDVDEQSNIVEQTSTIPAPAPDEISASTSVKPVGSHQASPQVLALSTKRMMMIAGLIMAVLLVGYIVLPQSNSSESLSLQARMERGYTDIENYTQKGAIKDAQDSFSNILSDDPNNAAARAGLAFAVFREYTHLERDPALLQRGRAHAEAALREDEHLATANIAVAWAALLDGDLERANKYLDSADILDPSNRLATEARYTTFLRQGDLKRAKDLIDGAIENAPNYALFYTYRGRYFSEVEEDFKAAEADYSKAIALSPDSSRTYAQLAQNLHAQGRTGEAVAMIQKGLGINETALLYSNLGTYLFFQGQYDLAASAFEKALDFGGDSHDYLYWANLADAYRWSIDKKDDAATSYRRALQLLQVEMDKFPNDVNLRSRAALFNAKLGNLDKAQSFIDSMTLTPESPSIQLYRAVVTYEILSNRSKALDFLALAIQSDYPLIEILNDPELTLLRQDPAYHQLLAKTQN